MGLVVAAWVPRPRAFLVEAMKDNLRHRMAEDHERYLADVLRGRKTRGSGNQFANPCDGRQNRYETGMAFAWDGKSTLGKSISVSRAMWDKLEEQAHGERPLLPLRFYNTERLSVGLDLVVLDLDDFIELVEGHELPRL